MSDPADLADPQCLSYRQLTPGLQLIPHPIVLPQLEMLAQVCDTGMPGHELLFRAGHSFPLKPHRTGIRLQKAGSDPQDGRFPRSGSTCQGKALPPLKLEADAIQRKIQSLLPHELVHNQQ